MKLLHLADLHIGKIVRGYDMHEDQAYMLDQIIGIVREHQVNAVMIAGDIYDRSIPSEAAVRLLDDFLYRIREEGAAILAISGNHDSDERLQFASRLLTSRQVYMAGRYDGNVPETVLHDDFGPVRFFLLPFVKASRVRHFHPDLEIENYSDAIRCALGDCTIPEHERCVLLAHQFVVSGGLEPVLSGSEGVTAETVGTIEKVDAGIFDAFDYVALGHIHRPQAVGRETCRYAGSMLKYSASEAGHVKTLPLITMEEKGKTTVELLPLHPKRDLRLLRGPVSELLNPENVTDPDDYVFVELTDEHTVPDAMDRIRHFYPRVMSVSYNNAHTRQIEAGTFSYDSGAKSFRELMREFSTLVRGEDISEEEWDLLEGLAEQEDL